MCARKPESALRIARIAIGQKFPQVQSNVLEKAISVACEGGVIYLKSGVHTENYTLNITKPINLIGENGAILKLKFAVSPLNKASESLFFKIDAYRFEFLTPMANNTVNAGAYSNICIKLQSK